MTIQEELGFSIHRRERPGPTTFYLRTTPFLSATAAPVEVGYGTFRVFSRAEAEELGAQMKKRNVFVRYYADRDAYSKKVASFADASVLLLSKPASGSVTPDSMRVTAERLERVVLLVAAYTVGRRELHRRFSSGILGKDVTDLFMAGGLRNLSTKTLRATVTKPFDLDSAVVRRLSSFGLDALAGCLVEPPNESLSRVGRALSWLWESRLDRHLSAAFVKTTIGFETLFVFDASENPRRTIAERLAFLLGRTPEQRAEIAKFAKVLYDDRSAVVHGGNRQISGSEQSLERADRVLLLASLALAHNALALGKSSGLRDWFERLRWSMATEPPPLPFSSATLERALR